jgi:uncharacterized protein YifN (PemK superfamily)
MPHALRVFKCLRAHGLPDDQALAVAGIVETAKSAGAIYDRERIVDDLCDASFTEERAEAIRDVLRNCFLSQRFSVHFDRPALKFSLVRAGWTGVVAEAFLNAVSPSVATPRNAEVRQPVQHQQSPGRVVMCDFTFLLKPEMQKERRAIVVSARSPNATGRCAVVPVSKLESTTPNPHHFKIEPGTYPFFHATEPVWAVCDHIYTVSLERLWMVNVDRKPAPTAMINAEHLTAIRNLLGTSLGVER